jgi:hypothetical protein
VLTIWIPPGEPTTYEHCVIAPSGPVKHVHQARAHGPHQVISVPQQLFQILLGSGQGLRWEKLNPKAIEWMARMQGANTYMGEQFPDENNPPPVPVVVADVAPVSVRMRAPAGASSYSHEGIEHRIGQDGMIEIDESAVDVFRALGFALA